jgi:hypothetical protein
MNKELIDLRVQITVIFAIEKTQKKAEEVLRNITGSKAARKVQNCETGKVKRRCKKFNYCSKALNYSQ